nr:DMT family transporter [Thaumasiovibrio subtropicus]
MKLSVGGAMGLLVFGNIVAVFSDALIKSVAQDVPVFQFVLFRQITAVLMLLPFCLKETRETLMQGLKWHVVRAHVWLLGAIFMFFAIQHLSLATANAIFYAAPLMMLPLAFMMYREQLSRHSILAGVMGFVGVLVIIRPTDISWGALAALVVAFALAMNNLLIRKLPTTQSVAVTLFLTNIAGIPLSTGLAVWQGGTWHWSSMMTAAGSSFCILIYAATCVVAYRAADSNKIASAEYSGLLGAVAVGIWWFGEMPDWAMAIGATMIIMPLWWLSHVEKKRRRQEATETKATGKATGLDNSDVPEMA